MMFQFRCYKQIAPPGIYSIISAGIRTVVNPLPAHSSIPLIRVVPPLRG